MPATSPIINIMIKAAEKAGRSLTRDFGEVEQLQVSRKGPADFVTAADKRAEEIIFEELKKARPAYSFLMEESGKVEGTDTDHVWIIDPLDGTHNFMHGVPHWCVSIALSVKDRIEAAVIYDPIKEEVFHAERSGGAFTRGKRLRVSGRSDMESAMIAFGVQNPTHRTGPKSMAALQAVSVGMPMLRFTGSAALDLCYVAAGRLDAYWDYALQPWDVAAGYLIVKEAGGFISSIDDRTDPIYSGHVIAGNQEIYNQLHKILKDVSKA